VISGIGLVVRILSIAVFEIFQRGQALFYSSGSAFNSSVYFSYYFLLCWDFHWDMEFTIFGVWSQEL
jgi:hypothetical protein